MQKNENSDVDVSKRVALVTGGSRGIGRAACLKLAESATAIAVHFNRSSEGAEETVSSIREMGVPACAVQANLREPDAGERLVRSVEKSLGPVAILVNNAAEFTDSPVVEMSDEAWNRTLAVNLSAVFQISKSCLPGMKLQGWGRIVNLSSQAAFSGSKYHAHYATTKSGVLGFTYSLAKEMGPFGITVNVVAPGRILTEMIQCELEERQEDWLEQTPVGRFGRPEEVAAAIGFLASEEAGYITGSVLNVSGGLVMG